MKPEYKELSCLVNPRLTAEPRRRTDLLDFEHYDRTGEELYIETINDEDAVDPFDEGLAPEDYWAEGWDFGSPLAYRHDTYQYDDVACRMFPTRYRIADFNLSRGFRRVLKKNADLQCVARPFRITPAKDALDQLHCYSRFQEIRAPLSSLYAKPVFRCAPQHELTVFHPTRGLIAFSIIDIGENASYAVRTAWTPDEKQRSLGTYTFLKTVGYAESLGFEHHYVGPTILADPAFSYKLRFPACEIYDWEANDWVESETERAKAIFAAPLLSRRWNPETEDWAE